ncbi:hypothetical protein L226DRAFT_615467 [Lentinus tigrinus ALCF2SS1-7]|uniref:Yeast cell wall synthesis Kre9/Knh1-like N-terminal domain-containing protein n=1 Tax=Lentinus tigrinus ALCF2SS1-6 TaxID=1328759 RepID=A0A5C2RZL3_9APHY|nr:hypothetical protein L227DRAFT_656251 [Lentinus tigrinus ALCF2SS1-6]RPD71440.1 hypothetical protein L226DRAFT_615467 [Lentinus tigrinus ALCF2SS1-7]
MFAQTSSARCLLFFTAILGALEVAHAVPSMRDVYVPHVIYPCKGALWHPGQTYNVTWDASSPPNRITNPVGKIYLRKGEHTTDVILAKDFNITDGHVNFMLPKVQNGGDYKVVLFGDSGNFSDEFTITETE